ncbi:hypothetical protein CERSUDRAFT_101689, partial [Gelatoporia subvermispora B]
MPASRRTDNALAAAHSACSSGSARPRVTSAPAIPPTPAPFAPHRPPTNSVPATPARRDSIKSVAHLDMHPPPFHSNKFLQPAASPSPHPSMYTPRAAFPT